VAAPGVVVRRQVFGVCEQGGLAAGGLWRGSEDGRADDVGGGDVNFCGRGWGVCANDLHDQAGGRRRDGDVMPRGRQRRAGAGISHAPGGRRWDDYDGQRGDLHQPAGGWRRRH